MTNDIKQFPLLDEILDQWKEKLAEDYQGYRNHALRVLHFCSYMYDTNEEEEKKLTIAAALHDIGIWRGSETTADYIESSLRELEIYLEETNQEDWLDELSKIIEEHHKVRKYKENDYQLVEVFRKADLIDFSRGFVKLGVDKKFIEMITDEIPNEGFHSTLWRLTKSQIRHSPLNPLPMLKM